MDKISQSPPKLTTEQPRLQRLNGDLLTVVRKLWKESPYLVPFILMWECYERVDWMAASLFGSVTEDLQEKLAAKLKPWLERHFPDPAALADTALVEQAEQLIAEATEEIVASVSQASERQTQKLQSIVQEIISTHQEELPASFRKTVLDMVAHAPSDLVAGFSKAMLWGAIQINRQGDVNLPWGSFAALWLIIGNPVARLFDGMQDHQSRVEAKRHRNQKPRPEQTTQFSELAAMSLAELMHHKRTHPEQREQLDAYYQETHRRILTKHLQKMQQDIRESLAWTWPHLMTTLIAWGGMGINESGPFVKPSSLISMGLLPYLPRITQAFAEAQREFRREPIAQVMGYGLPRFVDKLARQLGTPASGSAAHPQAAMVA